MASVVVLGAGNRMVSIGHQGEAPPWQGRKLEPSDPGARNESHS